jgi:thiosulfate/3-mercaptopyruvate sulfurtransferase
VTEPLAPVVDAAWVQANLGAEDLLLADVRGPNAHARGHLPQSIPLVLGSPSPSTDRETLAELAEEVGVRLRRHGVRAEDRLVLYDGGDLVGAAASATMAELAGHRQVAVLVGGLAGWPGEVIAGAVDLERSKAEFEPNLDAVAGREELAGRLGDPTLAIVDVRRDDEFRGKGGYPCDPRQGHIPGARHVEVARLFGAEARPLPPDEVRRVAGLGDVEEVVVYCHSGSRSALAMLAFRAAGYRTRNYVGSWHEWSRHKELPAEK